MKQRDSLVPGSRHTTRAPADATPDAVTAYLAPAEARATGEARADVVGESALGGDAPLDARDQATRLRLQRRVPGAGYEIADADMIRAIRAWDRLGNTEAVRALCEALVDRCMPEFQRRSWGLRHRPELMQDAIGGMIEQLLREVRDPSEQFMLLNFIHYLHCLCADNFGRILRQEGLQYRRDEQGRPLGRPQHVPRALVERIDVPLTDGEEGQGPSRDIPQADDPLRERLAVIEAERILAYLTDPMDRQIMALRVFEHLRWDDIAAVCGKTERTMRLRYEKARIRLRECIEAEQLVESVR